MVGPQPQVTPGGKAPQASGASGSERWQARGVGPQPQVTPSGKAPQASGASGSERWQALGVGPQRKQREETS
jgi:hypothetical protein